MLAQLFRDGRIGLDALVWRDGMPDWQPLSQMSGELGLLADAPVTPPPAPADPALPEAPATATADDGRAVFTAREPSYQAQREAEAFTATRTSTADYSPYSAPSAALIGHGQVVLGGEVVYAGFWKRVAAYMIDSIIAGLACGIVGAIIGGVMGAGFGLSGGLGSGSYIAIQAVTQVVSLILGASYFAYFHASSSQATPGKMAVGIKVVAPNGESISFMRGFGRYFAMIVSSLTLCIGFAMAGFTERKRALHDMISGTLVVDRWAFTDQPERQRPELGGVTIAILAIFGVLMLLALVVAGIAIAAVASRGFGS
ncbi:Uncharacterized membrane protein YckC, RDD family [Pseudoxanthomonas sp. GM95]|nr:Uncharacterized membrane protein YckC, RDD family [Pseudoxanthomonas sp. GM95]